MELVNQLMSGDKVTLKKTKEVSKDFNRRHMAGKTVTLSKDPYYPCGHREKAFAIEGSYYGFKGVHIKKTAGFVRNGKQRKFE